MKQLGAFLFPHDREDTAAGRQRPGSVKNEYVTSESGKHGLPLRSSKINYISHIESQAIEKQ
jgi:hypothetical protein